MNFTKFFENNNNQLSSKRLMGAITILTALCVGIVTSVFAIFIKISDGNFIEFFIGSCFCSGTALIAAGIAEKFKTNDNMK